MRHLATACALLLAACFPTQSDQFVCQVTADCESGRSCDRGFCVLSKTDAGGADAGPSDAAPDATADARPCTGGTARATDPTSGACFVFFNQNRNHTDAEAACVALAMHLATIRSASENTTADSLIGGNDVFIGLNDIVAEGQYRWPDGSAPVFTNYRSGEPNNGGGGGSEDCTLLEGSRGGTWDDRACVSQVPYICSFE